MATTNKCDLCNICVEQNIYKCLQCPCLVLCSQCSKLHSFHNLSLTKKEGATPTMVSATTPFVDPPIPKFDWPLPMPVGCSKIYIGVTCDGCKVNPIMGMRYKCTECHNYDLCGDCKTKGTHSHHSMVYVP